QPEGAATVGVMAPGEYEFGTGSLEIMHVITGQLTVKLPGSDHWEDFGAGTRFTVPANSRFNLKVEQDTAYLCEYRGNARALGADNRLAIQLDELPRHPLLPSTAQLDAGEGGMGTQQRDSVTWPAQLEPAGHAQLAVPTDDPGPHAQLLVQVGRRQVIDLVAHHYHGPVQLLVFL